MSRNLKTFLFTFVALLSFFPFASSQTLQRPGWKSISPEFLPMGTHSFAAIKNKLIAGDSCLLADLKSMLSLADSLLLLQPLSVLDDTTGIPGGDPHDYTSFAPYWWPNPETENGLPYIRKDGEINHALRDHGDDKVFESMAFAVKILAMSYFYSGEEKYAVQAIRLIDTWFLRAETKMHPHAERGQIIPGVADSGRRAGINEMRFLIYVTEASSLLSHSPSWTEEKREALNQWFREFFEWLSTSRHGLEEKARPNNHGTWYDVEYVAIALFLKEDSLAKEHLQKYSIPRIEKQINPDGSQPLEVSRGFSLHYCMYNVEAWFTLADLALQTGTDLWSYEAPNRSSIRLAWDYLLPYIGNEQSWPYPDKGRNDAKNWFPLLARSALVYPSQGYGKLLVSLQSEEPGHCRFCYELMIANQ